MGREQIIMAGKREVTLDLCTALERVCDVTRLHVRMVDTLRQLPVVTCAESTHLIALSHSLVLLHICIPIDTSIVNR